MGDAIRPHLYDAAAGTAALPSYTFLSDRDTGFYRAAANQLGITLGGAAKLLYSAGAFAFQEATTISSTGTLTINAFTAGGEITAQNITVGHTNQIRPPNTDSKYFDFFARDNGVGLVVVGGVVGAADPHIRIGRDDTGVALNAVTDMLVLTAGGGTGNEAAGFGLGLSVQLGNAASQVEERGSLDIVLQTATDASEDASWIFQAMVAGAMATVLSVGGYAGVAKLGFYATAPVALQTGVAVTAAGIHTALVNLGLITA